MTKYIFLFLSIFISPSNAELHINVYSLPKSGTYLICRILGLWDVWHNGTFVGHLINNTNTPYPYAPRRVVNIRDLRDCFASFRSFADKFVQIGLERGKNWNNFKPIEQYKEWLSMTDDEKLMAFITLDPRIPLYENSILENIIFADIHVKEARYNQNILITKYESWVGEKGGGSFEEFSTTLKKFADHFEYSMSPELILNLYDTFWGNTLTFDQGKIGRWKTEFNAEHIAAFKNLWNNYLIEWGYEISEDW